MAGKVTVLTKNTFLLIMELHRMERTQLKCDDECCGSVEDCHIEAGFSTVSDCEPPKEETIEEACDNCNNNVCCCIIREEAKRMYSEENMKQFAFDCVANFLSNNDNKVEMELVEVIIDRNNKKFEQFKKK